MAEEKDLEVAVASSQTSASNKEVGDVDTVDWSPEEEQRLVRKLDWIILPPLVFAFLALQLDRGNIGAAYTDGFAFDVGITQDQYNTGNTLFSVGTVVLQIPSNLILYRIGPTIWVVAQIFAFGLVSTFQAWQHGRRAFFATRTLLGLCESGFIPAGLYTLSRWYKKSEISKRYAIYFFGNNLATAISGLLASGILRLDGVRGFYGWQWLFIIEGVWTLATGVYFAIIFPKSPDHPVSLLGIRWFSEHDSHIMTRRVLIDDPAKAQGRLHVSWHEIRRTITNWRLFSHIIIPLAGIAPSWTLGAYAPYLIMEMGYGLLTANALCSIGGFMLLPMNLLWGYIADRTRRRGLMVSIGLFLFLAFTIANRKLILVDNKKLRLPMLIFMVAFSACWYPINASLVALNASTPEERSVSLATVTMCANLAGIIGSNLFRASDAPFYPHGWDSLCAVVGTALAFSLIVNLQYYILNRRMRNKEGVEPWHI
ncbi:putative MFS transporter [Cryphonectria parasitica EP155]|uniref:MFS transporter n=1 Tax=Cryphonectria parasitica (strain ATCC 38755 / EP155) TaxID=660469 RepID=A0A9P5CTA5_CRYP1|nr:putative MFS transporter [Cryphonectria parasitica EP155]KAF3769457.1 putative MFS transporter [Cryphonectria parasitica EP155]